jgi:protein TonB
VSRSLLVAFFMALILHGLLAWVKLDLFKGPVHVRRPPKALTVSVVTSMPTKQHPLFKRPENIGKPAPKKPVKKKSASKPRETPKEVAKKKEKKPQNHHREEKQKEQEEITDALPLPVSEPIPEQETLPQEDRSLAAVTPDLAAEPQRTEDRFEKPAQGKSFVPMPVPPVTLALPDYRKNRPPAYPLRARRRGYQGTVLLEVLVARDGTVASVRLVRSSGAEILDTAAKKGVKKWLFHPGKKGDEVVEMWVRVPIRFQLK